MEAAFFFNDTATTEIYTLSLHDALPISAHASLNLAQAVLLGLYELHLAAADATRKLAPPRKNAPPATVEQYELLFADVERGLEAIDFFKSLYYEHIMRSLRTIVFRSRPDGRELALLRAVFIEIVRTVDRISGRREKSKKQ